MNTIENLKTLRSSRFTVLTLLC